MWAVVKMEDMEVLQEPEEIDEIEQINEENDESEQVPVVLQTVQSLSDEQYERLIETIQLNGSFQISVISLLVGVVLALIVSVFVNKS